MSILDDARRHFDLVAEIGADFEADPLKWQVAGGPGRAQHCQIEMAAVCALISIAESLDRLTRQDPLDAAILRHPASYEGASHDR